jgi:hypothetical protein
MEHKQVLISWREQWGEVDEELAPLVLALWKHGINATNSGQEDFEGIAWIEFLTPLDAKRFLDLVAVYPPEEELHAVDGLLYVGDVPFSDTLYGRITGCDQGDWEYNIYVRNWGVTEDLTSDGVVEACVGPSNFDFFVSVRFPRGDLPLILERVKGALREQWR